MYILYQNVASVFLVFIPLHLVLSQIHPAFVSESRFALPITPTDANLPINIPIIIPLHIFSFPWTADTLHAHT